TCPRSLEELLDQAVHHLGALEDVRIFEQVGLEGQHLLDAQRPLLVPWPRQAERLVPSRKLDDAHPSTAAQHHNKHLERDTLNIVLKLDLDEPEKIDLHAIAKT